MTVIYFGPRRVEIDWLNVATYSAIALWAAFFGWRVMPVLQRAFALWVRS